MKLKGILSIVAAGILTCGLLAGCGGSGGAASGGSSDSGSAEGAGGNITLVLSQRDEFLSTLVEGTEAAAKEMGYTLTTVDCQSDAAKAIQYVETARNAGEKAVIINMVDPTQAAELIEAAGDMKVVFVNRCPDDTSVLTESAVYVGSDEMTSGKFQGDAIAEYFKAKGQTDVKYILLNGIMGQTSTTNRTASFLQAMKDNGINAVEASAPLACEYDRATAQEQITPLITSGLEYDCIVSNNDAMALGAIEALKSAGKDPGEKPIVGIDCTADGAQAVADGEMLMTVFQNAAGQGSGALHAVDNLLNGKAINEGTDYSLDDENANILWIPFEPVNADNVADYQ